MGERVAVGRLRECLVRSLSVSERLGFGASAVKAEGESQRGTGVRWVGVRCASGGANPAREAKAASPSKVVKKGGGAEKEAGPDKRDRFASLIQSCLDSPAPVRALKEKDRLREIEREKLGIVSKDKERALEREKAKAKAVAKEKKKADKAGAVEVAGETAQPAVAYNLTAEDGMKLAKEYSRHLMKEARLKAAAENVRLKLKMEAIAALPPHLREAALVPDLTPFPPTRIPASISPPIPGYMEEMARASEQAAKIQKSR